MNKLILIRSGSTPWQQGLPTADESRLQGTVPLPLTDQAQEALQQICAAVEDEHVQVIYSSGNESSGPTAQFIADQCRLKSKKVPLLRELDCGLWQGLRISEIKKRYGRAYKQWRSDPTCVRPPQGEGLEDAAQRVEKALQDITDKNRGKTVIIVAALLVAAIIECILTETSLDDIWPLVERDVALHVFALEHQAGKHHVPRGVCLSKVS